MTDAIAVNREVGGNLAELFEGVSETIRLRTKLGRQVKALSAEGRLSAKFLIALPFAVFAWFSVTNRSYVHELYTGIGPLLLIGGAVLMVIGYFWTRRIVQIDY